MVSKNLIVFIYTLAPICFMFTILKGRTRTLFLFLLYGLFICFFSGELSGLILNSKNVDITYASINIIPIIEETLKFFPLVMFAIIYNPDQQEELECSIALGLGFAVLENIIYLIKANDISLLFVIIRGFCSGPLHCLCTLIMGYSLKHIKRDKRFFVVECISLLGFTIIIHAIYNLLIQSDFYFLGAFIPFLLFVSFRNIKNN